MDLRKSHEQKRAFDAFLILLAFIGVAAVYLAFSIGGAWRILGYVALACLVLLIYGVFIEPRRLTVAKYREALSREPSVWIRLAFLCDMHASQYGDPSRYERIVNEVQALTPDAILLGGDYVADKADFVERLETFSKLRAPLGKFFVLGNHDYQDRPQQIRRALRSYGYEDLTNRGVTLERESGKLEVQGVDDTWCGKPEKFSRAAKDIPHITLTHEPDILLDLREGETDLVLAGHTHGGQARLPVIGALWPIPSKLKRAVDRGRKIVHGVPCIISSGLGECDGHFRLFSPPQIVIVEVGI